MAALITQRDNRDNRDKTLPVPLIEPLGDGQERDGTGQPPLGGVLSVPLSSGLGGSKQFKALAADDKLDALFALGVELLRRMTPPEAISATVERVLVLSPALDPAAVGALLTPFLVAVALEAFD